MRLATRVAACAALTAIALAQPASAAGPRLVSQPILAFGSAAVDARAVNNAGTIVGGVTFQNGGGTGFMLDGSVERVLQGLCGTSSCMLYPTSISNNGTIAGFTGGSTGAIWQNGVFIASNLPLGQLQYPQSLPSVSLSSNARVAFADNASSSVVVYAGTAHHVAAQKGLSPSHVTVGGINASGVIAGFELATIQGTQTPVVFFGHDGFFDMIGGNGVQIGSGGLINDAGQVAYADASHLYIYAKGVTTTVSMPTGTASMSVQAENNRGRIVGTYTDTAQMQHIFIYDGSALSTYGTYPAQDQVHLALNDRRTMLVSDRQANGTVSSARVECVGRGC